MPRPHRLLFVILFMILVSCREREDEVAAPATERPSILLVTLDTTRADFIGPDAEGADTPAFNALAARGLRFTQAYATTPQTLPSHSSMLTGMYPGGHGVHENSRPLAPNHPLLAEELREAGYRTAAFVSAFPLARRFGLARGFEVYDDELPPDREERSSAETTDRASAWLERTSGGPLFLWVHYFDPHFPYEAETAGGDDRARYRGEIAAMDRQLARLLAAFEKHAGSNHAIIVAADHGEGLGDHGEAQHGNLVYQSVMHVPLVIAGQGVEPGTSNAPVSIRRIFHTIRDWAGLGDALSLRGGAAEVVLGEAMIPFLQFGWQPQVMAVEGNRKAIHAGRVEIYDLAADPSESTDLAGKADLSREMRAALRDYPIPSPGTASTGELTEEERRKLASLGYIASDVKPVVRPGAPRPRDMVHLFDDLDRASLLFAAGQHAEAVPLLERILAADPQNLMTALRLAAAHSATGRNEAALDAFRRAERIAPDSPDVRFYLALHLAKTSDWPRAIPMLETTLAQAPARLPALETLAVLRFRQAEHRHVVDLYRRIGALRPLTAEDHLRTGLAAMELGETAIAIASLEAARALQAERFQHHLELGVLYVATNRHEEARASLDRVAQGHPAYPMALFKRAQVSVLLRESDQAERIEAARRHADATTRTLIENERLFRQTP